MEESETVRRGLPLVLPTPDVCQLVQCTNLSASAVKGSAALGGDSAARDGPATGFSN